MTNFVGIWLKIDFIMKGIIEVRIYLRFGCFEILLLPITMTRVQLELTRRYFDGSRKHYRLFLISRRLNLFKGDMYNRYTCPLQPCRHLTLKLLSHSHPQSAKVPT